MTVLLPESAFPPLRRLALSSLTYLATGDVSEGLLPVFLVPRVASDLPTGCICPRGVPLCEEALLYPCLMLCHLLSQHIRTRQTVWGTGVGRAPGAGKGHGNADFPQESCREEVDFLLAEVFKKRQNGEYQARYRRTSLVWMRVNLNDL